MPAPTAPTIRLSLPRGSCNVRSRSTGVPGTHLVRVRVRARVRARVKG